MAFDKVIRQFAVILFTFGFMGNCLIMAYFLSINRGKYKTMTNYHFLLITLALLDGLVCFSQIILGCVTWSDEEYTNLEIQMDVYTTSTFALVSIWVLALISFTRCQRLTLPFAKQMSKKHCFKVVLIMCCVSSVYHLALTNIPESKYQYLYMNSCMLTAEAIIPQILMFFFYYKTSQHMAKNTTQNQKSRKNRKNALKTLKGLVLLNFFTVFILKTILYVIAIVRRMESIKNGDKIIINQVFRTSNILLYYSTNILNVIVYISMMPQFGRFLLGILKRKQNLKTLQRRKRSSSIWKSSIRTSSI